MDMLPPAKDFLSHPLSFVSQYMEVYRLHTARISAETAERRKKKLDDIAKRSKYRKAHGLENDEGFGGWTAREDKDTRYMDWEGKRRPVKKWLGIW